MRPSLQQAHEKQVADAKALLSAQALTAVPIDPALLEHAKATSANLAALQTSRNIDELPELFAGLSEAEGDAVCAAGTSQAIVQAVENGTPISLLSAGQQVVPTIPLFFSRNSLMLFAVLRLYFHAVCAVWLGGANSPIHAIQHAAPSLL